MIHFLDFMNTLIHNYYTSIISHFPISAILWTPHFDGRLPIALKALVIIIVFTTSLTHSLFFKVTLKCYSIIPTFSCIAHRNFEYCSKFFCLCKPQIGNIRIRSIVFVKCDFWYLFSWFKLINFVVTLMDKSLLPNDLFSKVFIFEFCHLSWDE